MRCIGCNWYWADPGEEDWPYCHADPNWPTPCEEEEYETPDYDEEPSCSTCYNADQDTPHKVACCNCCEDYDFYSRA